MAGEPTRRRALQIVAATGACALTPGASATGYEWRGAALGADVSLVFSSASEPRAKAVVGSVLDEIERLEAVFSLQREDSEICRLNSSGALRAPSADFLHVLSAARQAHDATSGKFDPTIQPLWRFNIAWYARDRGRRRPTESEIAAARADVGFDRLRMSGDEIVLPAGGALTLNGIAQGYITDRACELIRRAGFAHVLVDLGESRALDARADGGAWRIRLPDGRAIAVAGGAIATSSGVATAFADNGDHHIFDPATGRSAAIWRWLSVAHPSATVADALSTGLSCLPPAEAARVAGAIAGVRLWGETIDGRRLES